jgi:O-antigen biosynthesis protein
MNSKSLSQLYAEHTGKLADKWSLYLDEYQHILSSYRDRPIKFFEIGVQNGGSLDIWSKYFQSATDILGCDINPDCGKLKFDDNRVFVVVGDANDKTTKSCILNHTRSFDVIIDDGSHISKDIVKSFVEYFPYLSDGGVFIVEDLHCSYWDEFIGGLYCPFSAISFFKRLVDVINYEHWGVSKKRADVLYGFFEKYGCHIDDDLLANIHSVMFINSMCIIKKSPVPSNTLGRRIITGSIEDVVPGHMYLNNSVYEPKKMFPGFDQSKNSWSTRAFSPEETAPQTEAALNEMQKLAKKLEGEIELLKNSLSWRLTAPLRLIYEKFLAITKCFRAFYG